ncbi:hypothetical protein JCM3765_002355 [Sporobolomyces pararoseus]
MPPRRRSNAQTPRDASNPGAVTGPRSALTSFLREQGITGPGATGFNGRINRPNPTPSSSDATHSTPTSQSDNQDAGSTTTTSVSLTTAAVQDESNTASPIASTSTSSVAASPIASTSGSTSSVPSKRKPQTKAQTEAQLKRQKKIAEEGFMLAGKSFDGGAGSAGPSGGGKKSSSIGRYENRTPGSISVCSECGKKFTVSKYTASNPNGPGMLCGACTTESIEDRATFPSASTSKSNQKKPIVKKKKSQKSIEETLYKPVITLQQTCLSVIGQYINQVEQLGDLGSTNLDRISKIVCKNRALNSENLKLFLEVSHTELNLYDCTNVKDQELASISIFCPHLVKLKLNLCGRLDDDVLNQWEKGFQELKHLDLYAPYLVTANKWKEFFEKRKEEGLEFETFKLRMSSRFNEVSLASLVSNNPNLISLKLSEIGRLTGDSLKLLYPLKKSETLRSLDLSRLGTPQGTVLKDEEVIDLLKELGKELDELILDGNYNLTDRVLNEGVLKFCPNLKVLSLSDLSEIENFGFESLFSDKLVVKPQPQGDEDEEEGGGGGGETTSTTNENGQQETADQVNEEKERPEEQEQPFTKWSSPGLTHLNLHRCIRLTRQSLLPLLNHSGHSLVHLSLHSLDELDSPFLFELAEKCKNLQVLDLSFVRSVDNFVVGKIWKECENLKTLFVHGNNRVTSDVPRKKDAQLRGLENAVHSEIPSGVIWES